MNRFNGARSFYGYASTYLIQENEVSPSIEAAASVSSTTIPVGNYDHESLCSILLSLLPSLEHRYTPGCDIEKGDTEGICDQNLLILVTALSALRSKGGWNIPKVNLL